MRVASMAWKSPSFWDCRKSAWSSALRSPRVQLGIEYVPVQDKVAVCFNAESKGPEMLRPPPKKCFAKAEGGRLQRASGRNSKAGIRREELDQSPFAVLCDP